jgi:aspartyl-tRNA synthetase
MNPWRDLYAGDVRPDHVGQELTVAGWVARRRDHGGLIFIDLRDHTGIVQLVVNPERAPEAAQTAHDIRSEFVVRAQGEVVRRAPDAVNPNIPTGEVELQVNELEIVSRPSRCRSKSTTKASRSPSAFAIATSTCAATACSATCASPQRSSGRSGVRWRSRASSTCGLPR